MTTEIRPKPVTILDDARCIKCGYALRELSENRCPECGREFDPHDPFSMNTPAFRQRIRTADWVPMIVFAGLTTAIAVAPALLPYHIGYMLVRSGRGLRVTAWLLAALTIGWIARGIARRSILGSVPDPKRQSERWGRRLILLGAALIVIMRSGGVTSWSCPHGDSTRFGPIVITRNSDRGPCNNFCQVLYRQRVGSDTFVSIAE